MRAIRYILCILFIASVACEVGCGPARDPLSGWKKYGGETDYRLDKAIVDDYQSYIGKLTPLEKEIAQDKFSQLFCEDGTGQHAVEISIPLKGSWWKHVLLYDKSNKRIRVIKYRSGRYMS